MATVSLNVLIEQGSGFISMSFTDKNGNAMTPKTLTWTLTDMDGNVINNRNQGEVGSLASTVEVMLSGDDLKIVSGETLEQTKHAKGQFPSALNKYLAKRICTVEGTYDDLDHGNDIPFKDSIIFPVEQLPAVADV